MSKMVIESAFRMEGNDPIFGVAAEAKKRIAEIGAEAVTNSTLGALMDDDGALVTFKSVYDVFKGQSNADIAAYAPIAGVPGFLDKVTDACFKNHRPKGFIRANATPGGTGAIRTAVVNYSELGDKVLVPDWHWAPYGTIADENKRRIQTFPLFDETGSFNMPSYQEAFLTLLKEQGRVLSILNTPAHNPTGYSITDEEWKTLVAFYTETALKNPDAKLIILCDIAYIDFAGRGDSARHFMDLLCDMPENVLPLYAFSASKGFTMYGLRNGAIICVAPTEEIADEFARSCAYSSRGTWSNGTKGAQEALTKILSDEQLLKAFENEQLYYREILQQRAAAFIESAKKVGLEMCEYHDGFFISMPCENAKTVGEELMKDNIFLVALKKGLRFAPCAVSLEKCAAAPKYIKAAMDRINN